MLLFNSTISAEPSLLLFGCIWLYRALHRYCILSKLQKQLGQKCFYFNSFASVDTLKQIQDVIIKYVLLTVVCQTKNKIYPQIYANTISPSYLLEWRFFHINYKRTSMCFCDASINCFHYNSLFYLEQSTYFCQSGPKKKYLDQVR